LERNEYAALELADVFRQRKFKSGHLKYWDQLAVDFVSIEETDHTETRRYGKLGVHGGAAV
jgi:hypothetical protein